MHHLQSIVTMILSSTHMHTHSHTHSLSHTHIHAHTHTHDDDISDFYQMRKIYDVSSVNNTSATNQPVKKRDLMTPLSLPPAIGPPRQPYQRNEGCIC